MVEPLLIAGARIPAANGTTFPVIEPATGEQMAEVAQASGMRIICTTGAYFEEQGQTYTFRNLPLDDIAAIYEKEIKDGIGETGIKAGLIKIATGHGHVSDYERKLLVAAARAAVRCDVPLISHTQEGTCGLDQKIGRAHV